MSIGRMTFESLGKEDLGFLKNLFFKEEVYATLSSLCGAKAPGTNGISMSFWQFCWDFVRSEVMEFCEEFHELGSFEKSLNATFIVLVPRRGCNRFKRI